MSNIFQRTFGFIVVLLMTSQISLAGEISAPKAQVILEIRGQIENTNGEGVAEFDLIMVEDLGLTEVVTETPWFEETSTFSGVPLKVFFEHVGADGTLAMATALDDYSIEIPLSLAFEYGAILATRHNGELMSVRERGPLWLIFPWSDNPEINNEKFFAMGIWQLKRIEFR